MLSVTGPSAAKGNIYRGKGDRAVDTGTFVVCASFQNKCMLIILNLTTCCGRSKTSVYNAKPMKCGFFLE